MEESVVIFVFKNETNDYCEKPQGICTIVTKVFEKRAMNENCIILLTACNNTRDITRFDSSATDSRVSPVNID